MDVQKDTLTGKLLIAMPMMGDDRFSQSVVYICAHSDEGAMGLIVNKPAPDVRFSQLLDSLEIPQGEDMRNIRIHVGGPVEHARGFVLHSSDYHSEVGTLDVADDIRMTATLDVLEALAQGRGPDKSMMALGYAGWGPGQLEDEIGQNAWLTCDPREEIIFGRANEYKWTAALKVLGVDPLLLSGMAGNA